MKKSIIIAFWVYDQEGKALPIFYLSSDILNVIEGKRILIKAFDEEFWSSNNILDFERFTIIEDFLMEALDVSGKEAVTLFIIEERFRGKILDLIGEFSEFSDVKDDKSEGSIELVVQRSYDQECDFLFFLDEEDGIVVIKGIAALNPPKDSLVNVVGIRQN